MSAVLRTVTATRYVTPLREGGSLPALVEADDDGLYVLKFRGAGQGPKALVAELIAAGLGRAIDLPVPEPVLADLDLALGLAEPDPEIQGLLERSAGLNVGLDYLPGSLPLGVANTAGISPELAADVVWFDAFLQNVDRTPRNPNLLLWHRKLWLIDHGASLYFHHAWDDYLVKSRGAFPQVKDHVLLPWAGELHEVDAEFARLLTPDAIARVVDLVPEAWREDDPAGYREYLTRRLEAPREWVEEAARARSLLV